MSSRASARATGTDTSFSRFAALVTAIVGTGSTVLAVTVGTAAIAEGEGVGRALWIVLSVATLTGQGAVEPATHQGTVVMVLSVWMICNYVLLAVAAIVLWRSRPPRHRPSQTRVHPPTRG